MVKNSINRATLGGGCFWCIEALFMLIRGIEKVRSGYSGGNTPNPTYEEVCSGHSSYVEVVDFYFDENIISFEKIVALFWSIHDPTSWNKQGNDVGPQYKSVLFYHSEDQKKTALESKIKTDKSKIFSKPIVTEIRPFVNFYEAENYHQNYYTLHGHAPYCSFVIKPKIDKLKRDFTEYLK